MEPEPRIRFSVPAELSSLRDSADQLRDFLAGAQVESSMAFSIETVLEELATNAIKYGYRDGRSGVITFELGVSGEKVDFIIEDDGDAFDPTAAPDPAVDRPLEDMPIGGLGIHLVRSVTDGFEYERVNTTNRVHVWIRR